MPIFALKKIETIVGKQEFFEIIIDNKSQYDAFYFTIKDNKQYVSELKTLLTNMDMVANLQSLPETKCKDITPARETVKESLVSGKITYRPLWDFRMFLNCISTNILSLQDDPVRD